jgi:glycosyltransferase involved in cell wall biosynthesis
MALVSVVIPCYRYGHFLADSVGSVLNNQPGVDVRVLIIDDASPDDSAAQARTLAAADPRIEVWVHEKNKGHIATYNEGLLDWATGDYTVLLSADDMLTPGALTRTVALLEANPNVGFCYGRAIAYPHPGPLPKPRLGPATHFVWPGQRWVARRFREAKGRLRSPEVVVRTDLQRKVGGYDPALPHSGDTEMWMRLAIHADVGYVRGADQAFYRLHGTNMSRVDFGGQMDDIRQRRAAFDAVLERQGDLLADRDSLGAAVHRRLAREALRQASRAYDRGLADVAPVDELVDFARDCWPDYRSLPDYRALRRRQRLGTRVMRYLQPVTMPAFLLRRGGDWLAWLSFRRRGI